MPSDEMTLQEFLGKNGLPKYIRLQWVDYSGVLRTRFVPVARCLQIARGDDHFPVPQVSMTMPVLRAPCFPAGSDVETWVLRPDWSSLRSCGFRPSHASVMCFLEHLEAGDTYGKCPRMLLYRALGRLENEWGTKALGEIGASCVQN